MSDPGPSCYSPRLDDALALATDAFRHVVRKGSGVPYLTHLLQVMVTVGEHGGDEDQMIAAVLHDYLEDIEGATRDGLEARFGARVGGFVEALSDTVVRPKPPWKERKLAYIEVLRGKSADLKLVSAADKHHNASSILRDHGRVGDAVFERFTASKEQTLWYYRAVTAALGDGWSHPLHDELCEVVGRIHGAVGVAHDPADV